jgi:hypothetical protein
MPKCWSANDTQLVEALKATAVTDPQNREKLLKTIRAIESERVSIGELILLGMLIQFTWALANDKSYSCWHIFS